jgi:hypothetical protein
MTFLADIQAFAEKAMMDASVSTSFIAEDAMTAVVVNSPSPANPGPYAKGLLANQWYSKIGDDYSSEVSTSSNPNGIASLSRIKSTLAAQPFYKQDGTVTLTNNLSYAYRAEMLGWPAGEGDNGWHWSGRQGPYRMVAKSMTYIGSKYSQ